MLFNSLHYLFIFLPIVIFVYITLHSMDLVTASIVWLICASFYFYGNWKIAYLPILIASICVNFMVGRLLGAIDEKGYIKRKQYLLGAGILFNVSVGAASELFAKGRNSLYKFIYDDCLQYNTY